MELLTRWGRDIKEEGRVLGREEGKVLALEQGKALALEQGKALALEQGKALGLEEGKALGLEEGKILGARTLLLSIGQYHWGPPTKMVKARISKIKDLKKLVNLAIAVFESSSWNELLNSL